MWPSLEMQARQFAEDRHGAQRYGDRPYRVHLVAVRSVLAQFGHNGAYGPAAWLHDTVEDTGTKLEEIEDRFGSEVAALVWAVTGVGTNRKERCASAYEKIRALPAAATLKLADRIANVKASRGNVEKWGMYGREWGSFYAAIGNLGDQRMWKQLRKLLGVGK